MTSATRGLDLEAEQKGVDEVLSRGEPELARGERRRQDGRRGMSHHGEVRVVEVEGMRRGAIGQRRPDPTGAAPGADDGAERRAALGLGHRLDDAGGGLRRAREHHAEAVRDGAPRRVDGGRRAVFEAALPDEFREHGRHAHGVLRMAAA